MKTAKVLDPKDKLVYSTEEVAAVCGIGIPAARNMIHIKGFPVLKVGGRYLIPKQSFEKWLEQQTNGAGD